MNVIRLGKLDDDQLLPYRDLKCDSKAPDSSDSFVVEGRLLVERLMDSQFELSSVLTMENQLPIATQIVGDDIPIFVLAKSDLCKLVGFPFHRGLLACGRRKPSATVDQLVRFPELPETIRTIVICPGTQDDANLGGILRTASAFGADGLVLSPRGPDPFRRKVLRISMGAALQIPICISHQLDHDVQRLQQLGFQIAGMVLDEEAIPLKSYAAPKRLAILMGAEDSGLSEAERSWCDDEVTIPMHPGTDSLNVAVAFAIAMHQLRG